MSLRNWRTKKWFVSSPHLTSASELPVKTGITDVASFHPNAGHCFDKRLKKYATTVTHSQLNYPPFAIQLIKTTATNEAMKGAEEEA